jgi:putative ABC transport system substrate-binding protein
MPLATLGGAAAWPLAARAQQSALPVIGLLSGRSPKDSAANVIAFQRGLGELGYFDGQNVEIDSRWALGHYDQLPALAADLVRRKVTVIVATGGGVTSTRAAMAATSSIPIIFVSGGDPIDLGLVESLNKPGGNLTGVTFFLGALEAKRRCPTRDWKMRRRQRRRSERS